MITQYKEARKNIWNGDLILFKSDGSSHISRLISRYGRGKYSHAAIAVWRPDDWGGTLLLAESREFRGGRVIALKTAVKQAPGVIDVYRPKFPDERHYVVSERAATLAVRWAGHHYNARGIFDAMLLHAPLLNGAIGRFRGYRPPDPTDMTLSEWDAPKYCSQLVACAYRKAIQELKFETDWDPCPNLGDAFVEPSDLVRGGAFVKTYEGLVV